jgi:hypothetical protein
MVAPMVAFFLDGRLDSRFFFSLGTRIFFMGRNSTFLDGRLDGRFFFGWSLG